MREIHNTKTGLTDRQSQSLRASLPQIRDFMAKLLRERSGGKVVKIKSLRRGTQNTPAAAVENRMMVRHPISVQQKSQI